MCLSLLLFSSLSSFFLYFLVWPPPPTHCKCRGLLLYLITLVWKRNRPVAEASTCTAHNKHKTNIHATGVIWTGNPSKRAVADLRLRPPLVAHSSHTQNKSNLNPSTYHCNCYEDAEQDDQAEAVPRELLVCWSADVGPVGAGRGHIARHPASPETEQNTDMFCTCAPHYSDVWRMIIGDGQF